MVQSEGAHEHALVVAAQIVVEGLVALGFEGKKYGVDELHHVVALEFAELAEQAEVVAHIGNASALDVAAQVDVARIVFPSVAIACHCHFVAQCSQTFGKRGVYVAIVA